MYLETTRLILRDPTKQDVDAYLAMCNSEFVLKYNAMTPRTYDSVLKDFANAQDSMIFLLECKENNAVIGAIFVHEDSLRWGVESKELSYFLDEAYSCRGFMREALHALITHLFEKENLTCVAARVFAPNVASRKLLESLGFRLNGVIPACVKGYRDVVFDDTLHSVFKTEWHC